MQAGGYSHSIIVLMQMEYKRTINEYGEIIKGKDYFHEYLCCMMATLMQSQSFNAFATETLKTLNERIPSMKHIQINDEKTTAIRKRHKYQYTLSEEGGREKKPRAEPERFPAVQQMPSRQQMQTTTKMKLDKKGANGPYVCHDCGKILKRSSSLSNHRLIHKNVKAFKCEKCDASFLRKSDLGKHYAIHTGSKPYVCNICNKSFSQSSNMLTHKRRHSGVKPYKCDYCLKSFYRKVDVKRHEIVHTVAVKE